MNGLNSPIKRYKLADKERKPNRMQDARNTFISKRYSRIKHQWMVNNILCNGNPEKKAGVILLISDKVSVKLRLIGRNKGSYHMSVRDII